MPRRPSARWLALAGGLIAVLGLAFVVRSLVSNWSQTQELLRDAEFWWLILAVPIALAGMTGVGIPWQRAINLVGGDARIVARPWGDSPLLAAPLVRVRAAGRAVTPQDPGDPRCPSCRGAEWQRGARHVVIAPITGEAVAFRHQSAPHGAWTCHQCGYLLEGPGEATDLLEAVARPWTSVSSG